MAQERGGPELYEILTKRKQRDNKPFVEKDDEQQQKDIPPPPQRSGREIVFSLESAFVLFVGVIAILITAYHLGRRRGIEVGQLKPAEPDTRVIQKNDLSPLPSIEGTPEGGGVAVTGKEFTLKLRATADHSADELSRLRYDLRYALTRKVVKEGEQGYIYDNGQVYVLGIGLFKKKNDQKLLEMLRYFAADEGPAPSRVGKPYRGCSIAKTGDLLGAKGKVLR